MVLRDSGTSGEVGLLLAAAAVAGAVPTAATAATAAGERCPLLEPFLPAIEISIEMLVVRGDHK